MYLPSTSVLFLYVTALSALLTNIHWWHQMNSESCVKEKVANMKPSYVIAAVFVTILILLPVFFYGRIALGAYLNPMS